MIGAQSYWWWCRSVWHGLEVWLSFCSALVYQRLVHVPSRVIRCFILVRINQILQLISNNKYAIKTMPFGRNLQSTWANHWAHPLAFEGVSATWHGWANILYSNTDWTSRFPSMAKIGWAQGSKLNLPIYLIIRADYFNSNLEPCLIRLHASILPTSLPPRLASQPSENWP